MYDFSLVSCMFSALPLRWRRGPCQRDCGPSITRHCWGVRGLWGEVNKHTHSSLFSSLECSVRFFCWAQSKRLCQWTLPCLPNHWNVLTSLCICVQLAWTDCALFSEPLRYKRGQQKMMRWTLRLDLVESEQANRWLGLWRFKWILKRVLMEICEGKNNRHSKKKKTMITYRSNCLLYIKHQKINPR